LALNGVVRFRGNNAELSPPTPSLFFPSSPSFFSPFFFFSLFFKLGRWVINQKRFSPSPPFPFFLFFLYGKKKLRSRSSGGRPLPFFPPLWRQMEKWYVAGLFFRRITLLFFPFSPPPLFFLFFFFSFPLATQITIRNGPIARPPPVRNP